MDKTDYIEEVLSIEGTLRDNTSIVNPTIVVQTSGLISANYAYIEEFNRYYFINDIVAINLFLYEISMTCDVLMTYKSNILSLPAFVTRNQYQFNELISDNRAAQTSRKKVEEYVPEVLNYKHIFQPQYSNYNYILTTISSVSQSDDVQNPTYPFLSQVNYRNIPSSIIYNRYFLNYDALKALNEYIIEGNDNLLSGIVSIVLYPLDVRPNSTQDTTIHILTTDTGITAKMEHVIDDDPFPDIIEYASFRISNNNLHYYDYEPYSTYEIYIPYLGWREIKSEFLLNHTIYISYINEFAGNNSIVVVTNEQCLILFESCQLGCFLSLSSAGIQEINDLRTMQQATNASMAVQGSINSITSSLSGGLTGGAVGAAASGISSLGNTVGSLIGKSIVDQATLDTTHAHGTYNTPSGESGQRLFQSIRIRKTSVSIVNYNSEFMALNGRPLNLATSLLNVHGYTEVSEIHLDNIPNALKIELDMIERRLASGFII